MMGETQYVQKNCCSLDFPPPGTPHSLFLDIENNFIQQGRRVNLVEASGQTIQYIELASSHKQDQTVLWIQHDGIGFVN